MPTPLSDHRKRPSRTYGADRTCEVCGVELSRYNPSDWCSVHQMGAPRKTPRTRN